MVEHMSYMRSFPKLPFRNTFFSHLTLYECIPVLRAPARPQACVEKGRVTGLMCSYNAVNGVPSCANPWLLETVARGEWGFDGYVTADCDADSDVYNSHHYTKTPEESVQKACPSLSALRPLPSPNLRPRCRTHGLRRFATGGLGWGDSLGETNSLWSFVCHALSFLEDLYGTCLSLVLGNGANTDHSGVKRLKRTPKNETRRKTKPQRNMWFSMHTGTQSQGSPQQCCNGLQGPTSAEALVRHGQLLAVTRVWFTFIGNGHRNGHVRSNYPRNVPAPPPTPFYPCVLLKAGGCAYNWE